MTFNLEIIHEGLVGFASPNLFKLANISHLHALVDKMVNTENSTTLLDPLLVSLLNPAEHICSSGDIVKIHKSIKDSNHFPPLLTHPIILQKLLTDLLQNLKPSPILDFELDLLARAVCGFGFTNDEVDDLKFDKEKRKNETIDMLKYTLELVLGLSPVSNFDLYPFVKILSVPICTQLTINWISSMLEDISSFDRYIDMKESPPLLDLLEEIAITNPLQIPAIFDILWKNMLRPLSLPPLQQVVYRKVFMDKMAALLKIGFVKPVFERVKRTKEVEDFLKIHFVRMVLGIVEAPHDQAFLSEILLILDGVRKENFLEMQHDQAEKEKFVEFVDVCFDPMSDMDDISLDIATKLKDIFY